MSVMRVVKLLEHERRQQAAIKVVMMAAAMVVKNKPRYWQWTVWLATGITIRRIEAISA